MLVKSVSLIWVSYLVMPNIIELDDGNILTGKPIKFDGKNHGFPVSIFPTKPIQW